MLKESANVVKPTQEVKKSAENQVNTAAQEVKKVSAESPINAAAPKSNEIKVVETQAVENELQKKANEIELLKKQLESQLNKIARKNEIANHREVFLEKKRNILNAEKFLKTEKGFESNSIKISFQYPGSNSSSYGSDSFSISNKSLILKFIEVLIFEIEAKIKDIEYELISD
jgi:hypothetical protein